MRRAVLLLAAAAALVAPSCSPTPTPGTVDVVGDSVTVQSWWNRDIAWRNAGVGLPPGADVYVDAGWGFDFDDVTARERARVNDPDLPRPAVLVIAVGTNNASTVWGGDGWTNQDVADFRALLDVPNPATCVVVALPATTKPTPAFTTMRTSMRGVAASRPRTVVADWADTVTVHPELLTDDGIHLAQGHPLPGELADTAAADAYAAHLWAGVARCPR